MGGLAFKNIKSATPIDVPRLPTELYRQIAAEVQTKFETLFLHVTIPRGAPGKLDHGDVDFLVEGIRPSPSNGSQDVWSSIQALVGAHLHVPNGRSHSFGIKHPHLQDSYVQIDVEISPGNGTPDGAELFEWTKFMKGDSDLMQIIGITHRSLGLTCNDRGLHVRVSEIEPYNRQKSMLFLTRSPDEAIDFYGFDKHKYWQGFENESEIFAWITKGRFFDWEGFKVRIESSNDRSRMSKRPMFRRFVEDYMPSQQPAETEMTRCTATKITRKFVLEEALRIFGRHEQYRAMTSEHNAKEAEEALWKDIKAMIPREGPALGTALKGLKRWVDFENGKPFVTEKPLETTRRWTDVLSPDLLSETLHWVEENWERVKRLEQSNAKKVKMMVTQDGLVSATFERPAI